MLYVLLNMQVSLSGGFKSEMKNPAGWVIQISSIPVKSPNYGSISGGSVAGNVVEWWMKSLFTQRYFLKVIKRHQVKSMAEMSSKAKSDPNFIWKVLRRDKSKSCNNVQISTEESTNYFKNEFSSPDPLLESMFERSSHCKFVTSCHWKWWSIVFAGLDVSRAFDFGIHAQILLIAYKRGTDLSVVRAMRDMNRKLSARVKVPVSPCAYILPCQYPLNY